MSVTIKGIDMPKNCWECPLEHHCMKWLIGDDRPDDCPLVDMVLCEDCKFRLHYVCGRSRKIIKLADYCSKGERIDG